MSFISKRNERRIAAYQRELIETHYAEVENMYRQMRGWRHDYRNYIQTLKAYAAEGDMEAIKSYLDKLDTDLATVDGDKDRQPHGGCDTQQQDLACAFKKYKRDCRCAYSGGAQYVGA